MLNKPSIKEIKELRLETLVKMTDLATAGFGLVAALAWNDSIKALFDYFIPKTPSSGVTYQLFYAVLITLIVVFITMRLGRMTTKAKEELEGVKTNKK